MKIRWCMGTELKEEVCQILPDNTFSIPVFLREGQIVQDAPCSKTDAKTGEILRKDRLYKHFNKKMYRTTDEMESGLPVSGR